jgi:hypothetical protein
MREQIYEVSGKDEQRIDNPRRFHVSGENAREKTILAEKAKYAGPRARRELQTMHQRINETS